MWIETIYRSIRADTAHFWTEIGKIHKKNVHYYVSMHAICMNTLDHTDLHLLTALQTDAQLTSEKLGDRLNLSASQVSRRRQRLEAEGHIAGYRARLSPERLGLNVQAFVWVQMATHTPDKVSTFTRTLEATREVVNVWTLTGEADYLLQVYCGDLSALNALIHGTLLPHPTVSRVQSQIVMNQIKTDAPLPI